MSDDVVTPPTAWPFTTWRTFWRVSAVAHATLFVLRFAYLWLDDLVRAESGTAATRAIEECTGALGSFLISGLVFAVWRRRPLRARPHLPRVVGYLLLGAGCSLLHTTFMWGTRTLAFPWLGLGAYDYGRMPLRYAMELPGALIGFTMIVLALWLSDSVADGRRQELREAMLETALAESRLRMLQLQMQPHFLFNALNTIAAVVHHDATHADRLIGHLAALLRASYRTDDRALVPLHEELSLLEAYAALMRARFGDRLALTITRGRVVDTTLVPPLLLQPLVENAVRHGRLERDGTARIAVDAQVDDGQVRLRVFDDGPGVPETLIPFGTGLTSATQRLELLFGEQGRLTIHNVTGGFEVRIAFPLRLA